MSIYRIHKNRDFTTVHNGYLNDSELSFRAKGVLTFLLSKPDTWNATKAGVMAHGKEGRDAITSAMNELVAAGYLEREVVRNEKGQVRTITNVYETPSRVTGNPNRNRLTENPHDGEPPTREHSEQVNTDLVNTDLVNTEAASKQDEKPAEAPPAESEPLSAFSFFKSKPFLKELLTEKPARYEAWPSLPPETAEKLYKQAQTTPGNTMTAFIGLLDKACGLSDFTAPAPKNHSARSSTKQPTIDPLDQLILIKHPRKGHYHVKSKDLTGSEALYADFTN